MSRQLEKSKVAAHDLRRIFQEQVSCALSALDGRPVTDKAVHSARKQLKAARATLRLLRPALGSAYKRANVDIRNVARPLGVLRDGRVLIDTLDKLSRKHGSPGQAGVSRALKRVLGHELVALRRRNLKPRAKLERQCERLHGVLKRSAGWRLPAGGWEVPGKGLKWVYADGRKALKHAIAGGSPKDFHNWRKEAKYLRHQMQVLEPLWPGLVGEMADQAHKLSDYLGDDHDLVLLREKVAAHRECFRGVPEQQAQLALIDRRCGHLREKAVVLGRRIYEETPAVFETRFRKYWRLWKQETDQAAT